MADKELENQVQKNTISQVKTNECLRSIERSLKTLHDMQKEQLKRSDKQYDKLETEVIKNTKNRIATKPMTDIVYRVVVIIVSLFLGAIAAMLLKG